LRVLDAVLAQTGDPQIKYQVCNRPVSFQPVPAVPVR
jgi:hypothetical protein